MPDFTIYAGTAWGIQKLTTAAISLTVPTVVSVTPQSPDRIRVVFSEAMDQEGGLLFPGYYQVFDDLGQRLQTLAVFLVDSMTVDVYVSAMNDGDLYTMSVTQVRSERGVPVAAAANEFAGIGIDWGETPDNLVQFFGTYPGYGSRVQDAGWQIRMAVDSAFMISETKVRVTFNRSVDNNEELNDPSNYSISPLQGGITGEVINILTSGGLTVLSADLILSRALTISLYRAVVAPNKIGLGAKLIQAPDNTADFNASSVRPYVLSAYPVSRRKIEVNFSWEMDGTLELINPTSYSLDGGLYATKVTRTGATRVVIELSDDMIPDYVYNLTVVN
jgi:hypothetical protein